MTKIVIFSGMLAFGYFLGEGWKDAGEIVYAKVQQTAEASE